MDKQTTFTRSLGIIGWLLLRLAILNAIILTLTFILAAIRNIFEPTELFKIRFPFQLYVTTIFLTNFVYIIGNAFETIHLLLWDKKINFRDFEKKFFKVGLVMTLIVNITGIVMYFINYLD